MLFIYFYYVKMRIKPGSAVLKAHRYVCIFGGLYIQSAPRRPCVKLYSKLVARYSHLSGLKSGFNWKRGWRSMFVAIHYIKWNREGILGITPPSTHTTHTHTPFLIFLLFFLLLPPALCLCCNVHIFSWRYYNSRSPCWLGAQVGEWTPCRLCQIACRNQTSPAFELHRFWLVFTLFRSFPSQVLDDKPQRERERARVWQKKNHLILLRLQQTDCGTSLSPLWIFLRVCVSHVFFPVLPGAGLTELLLDLNEGAPVFKLGENAPGAGFFFSFLLLLFSRIWRSQAGHDWYRASRQVNSLPSFRSELFLVIKIGDKSIVLRCQSLLIISRDPWTRSWFGPGARGGKWHRIIPKCTTRRSAKDWALSGSCCQSLRRDLTSMRPRGCGLSTWRSTPTTSTDPGANPKTCSRRTGTFFRCLTSGTPITWRDFLCRPRTLFWALQRKPERFCRRHPPHTPSSTRVSSAPAPSRRWPRCPTRWAPALCRTHPHWDTKTARSAPLGAPVSTPTPTRRPQTRAMSSRVTAQPGQRQVYSPRWPTYFFQVWPRLG